MIRAICCCDNNWAIGKNNDLLYKLPTDMKHFQDLTLAGGIVVMGENTLLSFPKARPLKNRVNIVLCPEGHMYDDCICYHDFNKLVKDLRVLSNKFDVYIVGGAMFYKSMLPYCDQICLTRVNAACSDATAFFPNIELNPDFRLISESDPVVDNGYELSFKIYERQ